MSQPPETPKRSVPDLSVLRRTEPQPSRSRSPWRWLIPVLLLAAVALIAVRVPWPFLRPQVETVVVESLGGEGSTTVLTATGYTYARSRAAVGSKIIGRVVELPVDEGDAIRRGDLIAVLDSEDLEANLRQAEAAVLEAQARLADAERELARQRRLVAAEVTSQAELDAASTARDVAAAQVKTQRARVDALEAQLAYTVIRSPIDGVVIERNVEVGEMVAPGGFTTQQSTGAIVRIADPSSLEVEADINESYISRVELGQPASVRVDAVPDRVYRGRLRQIVPTADRQRAVVEVKVTLDDRDERLVPDMSCTVTFLEEEPDPSAAAAEPRLAVSEQAVLRDSDGARVFRLRSDGTVELRSVTLGEREGERVVIESGVSAGDRLVRSPSPELEDGQRVRPVSAASRG